MLFFLMLRLPPGSPLFPYTTLFRSRRGRRLRAAAPRRWEPDRESSVRPGCQAHRRTRSEEHTSELQSLRHLVCRLLLEKKKNVHFHQTANDHNEDKRQRSAT